MGTKHRRTCAAVLLISAGIMASASPMAAGNGNAQALTIQEQGSFAVGGTVATEPGTFDPSAGAAAEPCRADLHGDHLYAFYQIPVTPAIPDRDVARIWPVLEDLGDDYGRSRRVQNIFLRRNFPVYLIDQPRRGNAGRSTVGTTIQPKPDEQFWFGQFRVGVWPDYFEGVQFPRDPQALNQYFRAMTPDTGPFDANVMSDAVSALFDSIGRASSSPTPTAAVWAGPPRSRTPTSRRSWRSSRAATFAFPAGEVPDPMPSSFDTLEGVPVAMADFMKLTKIPIVIFYGDNIPATPTDIPTQDAWRVRLAMARIWRIPSTSTVATSPSCISRRSASRATRTSRSPT